MIVIAQGCKPQPNLGDVVTFCEGNSLILNATEPNCTYLWSTGATSGTITVTASGIYWVSSTNSCGTTIDSVLVMAEAPTFINFGLDRYFCQTDTLKVPFSPTKTYLWSTGSNSHKIPITQSGTYWVKVTNSCNTASDTITLTKESPINLNLGPDIERCNNNPVTLSVPANARNIQWSTGNSIPSINVSNPGTYWVKASNSCGTVRDTIVIRNGNNIDLGLPDLTNLCPGNSMTLIANGSTGSYLWSTGSTNKSISISTAGIYWVKYTNSCGVFYDTTTVSLNPNPLINLGPDTIVCHDENYFLDAQNPGSTYTWNTGATSQTIFPDSTRWYRVTVDNGCNIGKDSVFVEVLTLPGSVKSKNLCQGGDTVTLDAKKWGTGTTYFWPQSGKTSQSITVSDTGNYTVHITNKCGTVVRNFSLQEDSALTVSLGNDTVLCANQFKIRITPIPLDSIVWNTGYDQPEMDVSISGKYWVTVYNACGGYSDTINVSLQSMPKNVPYDTIKICDGVVSEIEAPYVESARYLWNTGDTTHKITVSSPGEYYFMGYNICDTIFDTIYVQGVYPLNVDLGPDVTLCAPNVHILDATVYEFDSILWSTGSDNGVLPVTKTGTYWVKVFNKCGVYSDTINITVDPIAQKKLSSKSVCMGQSASFSVQQNFPATYQWNTGQTTPSITASQQGWYVASIITSCGVVKDSAFLQVDSLLSSVDLGKDTVFCDGSLLLDPGYFEGASYRWSNGYSGRRLFISQSGTYWVRVSNSCNTVYDTIVVLVTGPPQLVLGNIVKFCSGNILTLNAQNPGCTYLWNTGDSTQTIPVTNEGKYWVTIENPCGSLVDTVEVIKEFPLPLNLGNDTVICQGETLLLDTKYPNVITSWNIGSSQQTIVVNQTGNYSATVTNSCGSWNDSIYIKVDDVPVFDLGDDTVICAENGSLTLNGPPGMQSYLWSNGSTLPTTTFYQEGKYTLEVSNHCFSYTDSINAVGEYPIDINLGNDTTLCIGEELYLQTGITNYTVNWESGIIGSSRTITKAGKYIAWAQNSCGVFSDTILVKYHQPLENLDIDTTICSGDTLTINLSDLDIDISWETGDTSLVKKFWTESDFNYVATNKCGTFPGTLHLDLSNCECPFYLGNAFSPNADNLNDQFIPQHSCDLVSYEYVVFNRWGQKVFTSTDDQIGWDGTINGEKAPIGAYVYSIKYSWLVYGQPRYRTHSGEFFLIR